MCSHLPASHSLTQSTEIGTRIPPHPWGGVDDCTQRTLCTYLLHPASHLEATGSPPNISLEMMGSEGEPWPDAVHGQGHESQLSLASAQRVDDPF